MMLYREVGADCAEHINLTPKSIHAAPSAIRLHRDAVFRHLFISLSALLSAAISI